MSINKVSQAVTKQTPQFVQDSYPLFAKFLEYYYKSQEKTGYGQNILNNFLSYLNIDQLNIDILGGSTIVVEDSSSTTETIVVENVDKFLDQNGTILIGDEVIFYERAVPSPSIAFSPGISYDQVQLKWSTLASLIDRFDGVTTTFPLTSQDSPVSPPSAQHLIVRLYGEVLVANQDYTVEGSNIVFQSAPRTRIAADDSVNTNITFLSGFVESVIYSIDDISGSFGEGKRSFPISRNGISYTPIVDEYVIAIYDNNLLKPKEDFTFDGSRITFSFTPLTGRRLSIFSIEAPIPSFGSGAVGFSRVNTQGQITSVEVSDTGSNYRFEYPPEITVKGIQGQDAAVKPLINGIKNVSLLSSGRGYSSTNPPTVNIDAPTKIGGTPAKINATVVDGQVASLNIVDSGSGYTFTPRISFVQPGGAVLAPPTIIGGSVSGVINVISGGQGYSTPPQVYIDAPTGENGIVATFSTNLNSNGEVASVTILNPGQGYEVTPRISVIDPVGAQVLQTVVDGDGRVVDIELLSGGSGYDDIPSVYIVDDRVNDQGVYIGGTKATAVAAIFNGQITDINITSFGSGYSADNPPKVVIQSPPSASASVEIGLGEVTGFSVISSGSGYQKCRFEGCARAASGIVDYTEEGNVVFSSETTAAEHLDGAPVKCLDALFVKRLLDKYTEQFLPDVPQLDFESIDVRNAIKNIKTFYSTKGTSFSVSYLFKLLYGENVSISYPKDQIIKPSSATWSINTILRATLVSGNPSNIKDALIQQFEDIADPNIKNASALVENFISIKTSDVEIFELVLSAETIQGRFVVPYKTKLAEPLDETTDIITVDSTIGWPERNGEFVIAESETVRYKEKSLNQFIECTRGVSGTPAIWDSATDVTSNFQVYLNAGTAQEVVMNIVGIVDAQQTLLTDTGSYYLPGDKLTVSKLGGTSQDPQLTTWLYNVKKLVQVESITFGGVNDQSATVTCDVPHGLLVGDQVTVYGANPIIYNGTFLVTSRDSATVFQYNLPQPAVVEPQGNILISVDLNKGKSLNSAVSKAVGPYTTNVQNTFFNDDYVYVASTGIPNYNIGPFIGSALLPGNQRKLNRFPLASQTISTKTDIVPGPIGSWVNGVSIWSYKSNLNKTFGAVTSINITNGGKNYDAAFPPNITIENGGGSGASAQVVVDGSITAIEVTAGGSGYTSSPLVSIVGGGGSGGSATAIVTRGVVSRILVNSGGSGYTSKPQITIVGGGGTGATADASVRGPIKSVNIVSGGSSYTSNPDVKLTSGEGAVAQAIVSNGRIISIAIINAGQGYTTAPEVTIQGDGFGAIAKATIDVDGENAGKVTNIEILNRGIGYSQGLTLINLTSVGNGAKFTSNVFKWTYNLQQTTSFDSAKGSVFEGFNTQYGGEYAHISNPQRLRYILGDNLFISATGQVLEQEDQLDHSPILGWAFDGNPIYGPYAYEDPTDQSSSIIRMRSSYALKTNLVFDAITNPYPERIDGPLLTEDSAGTYINDYQYNFGSGDLDQYNGRFCKTPDFPEGRYCYFVTIDATEDGNPVFPYVLGENYNSVVDIWNLNADAVQQNIPQGVIRYRDPYENVDIDVERTPNASTNALTTENGDILLFEVEDENRDGIISQDEIDDPEQIFEESPLQVFDYFPKVRFDSKVDIEVETIQKFEDASVTGFTVENPGENYQVNDILVFDNTDTDGTGVSARVAKIAGEEITEYDFETIDGTYYGELTTDVPHNLKAGDKVTVDYEPIMDNTNKTFVVRQYKGIEEIVVTQTGSGYSADIPPQIVVDGDGGRGEIEAVISTVGAITKFNIINSGSGYTENPRIILSHPQIFRKADYYVSIIENNNYVKVNDIFVNDSKQVYLCGTTLDASGNTVGFVSKFSSTGLKEWEKTHESSQPAGYTTTLEFTKLHVDGNNVWVVGTNRPNTPVLDSYNPDIVLAKYTQSFDGLSATLNFQKGYSGISGASRADVVTAINQISETRILIGGYTNTNSGSPMDAFLAVIDTTGSFVTKRKLASPNKSEKITDIVVSDGGVFFTMETADTSSSNNVNVSFGKVTIFSSLITVNWIKEISNISYSFLNSSVSVDEFDEYYVVATTRLKADNATKDGFWIGKFKNDGDLIWNYRYATPSRDIQLAQKTNIDIFGNLNLAYTETNQTSGQKFASSVKINYNGEIVKHTSNKFAATGDTVNNIEGITVHAIDTDVSGDVYLFGQTSWNRNEFVFEFDQTDDATDTTGHYAPTLIGNDATEALALVGDGLAKLFAYDIATPANWENAAVKFDAADLGTKLGDDWTLEFMLYKDSANTQTHSQTQQTLVSIGDATNATGGLWLYYDMSSGYLELIVTNNTTTINSAGSALQSTITTMYADNTWQFVGLKKSGNTFTGYVNGIQVFTGTISNTALANKDLYIGNIPGRSTVAGEFRSNEQGQFYLDNLRLRNRAVTLSVPSDVSALPASGGFGLAYDWTDDAWFSTNISQYDYIDYVGFALKTDKDSDAIRLGSLGIKTNTQVSLTRESISPVTGVTLTVTNVGYALGDAGLQSLDFNEATTTHIVDQETLTQEQDVWSSRNATVPAPGSQKVKARAVVKDRYYFKVTATTKIDNIQILTTNQAFRFTVGAKLVLNNSGTFVNSGYIVDVDNESNNVYIAVSNNDWSNDLNIGELTTERFDEQSTYGIRGPVVNDINQIEAYEFFEVNNTTPGTFNIDLSAYDAPSDIGGTNNLDEYSKFKPWATGLYQIRIVETSGVSPYIPGSVVEVTAADITFNAAYSTIQITNLTAVTKITLVTNLEKIIQLTAVENSDQVYVITDSTHYLSSGEMIYVDGNPSQQVGQVVYDEYDGAFPVDRVISIKEFVYKLPQAAVTVPSTNASSVSIFVKSPTLKMYYGHQYIFDLSHSTMLGGNLSFSKDSLYKLEYSFNSIQRIGTPGLSGEGQVTPSVKLKVDRDIVTNISYYFDPSRTGVDSPIIPGSFLDIVNSPYVGEFTITSTSGGTITSGDDTMRFILGSEPEGPATVSQAKYSTSSESAVGSISNIRIINSGGFYTKLPIVTNIISNRKIERVQINEPGTEYAVGEYTGVPIQGDGEGGLVTITVQDTTDDEGISIPGQIIEVVVTSPGKGYTFASIDVESIDGILGNALAGSGADLEVVIPPFGTGASIFTQGTNVGKIKKLKNNNFGYDYPHDYTLRPEITFPLNAQLTSTSILASITVTDPGSGYSQAPAVVITGGGGSGAIAAASIKNGRLDQIIVKDPGAGYSSTPTVELKSSFNYVINLDLGLLQFAFPHGILNGSAVTLNVIDTGDGAEFPLSAGALGRLNGSTTYYAITGTANSLEDDQLKLAITLQNAELGDSISFVNAGTGRQQILTSSFGGTAEANVITSTFLEGELIYQGSSLENATATGYISTNSGWQVGPRIVKIVNYEGTFFEKEKITGVISKSSGIISDLNIAKGVLEIGAITKTTGQFINDVGKPSEIIQKIQDSYYYQDFSYAINSSVSIDQWKDVVLKNVHAASFKVFGQLGLQEEATIPNKETFFNLTKSVELAREAIVPNIQNFALVEPIYQEFNNTEVLFRQKRLTSSENILTSVVQRLDDISTLFDGERIAFPLTVEGNNVVASANQLMIVLNGVVQNPNVSFTVQNDSIVFSEPPSPPASVKYATVTIEQIATKEFNFTNISGIFPNVGDVLVGTSSNARLKVTNIVGNSIIGFIESGTFITNELTIVNATGFAANLTSITDQDNLGLFIFGETIRNFDGDTAKVEQINLATGQETPLAELRFGIGLSTTQFEVIPSNGSQTPVAAGTFNVNSNYQFGSEIFTVTGIANGAQSTTLTVTRGQLGTAAAAQLQSTPIYGTNIQVTDTLTLSKTTGTYQSTPGLFDIQLDDVIIASGSGVVARVTSTSAYQDPATQEFIGQVNISDGSSFFGFLFNRITSTEYPNIVLDDISQSQVSIVDYNDNSTAFDLRFPANEFINNYVIKTENETGDLQEDEFIRNVKLEYGNSVGNFVDGEGVVIRKITFKNREGSGFFSQGQVLRSENTKAEVVGYNQPRSTIYLGKIGRTLSTGQDYHVSTFNGGSELSVDQKKYGASSLYLDGVDSYISIPSSTEFGFSTNSFTVEAYIYLSDLVGNQQVFDFRNGSVGDVASTVYISNGGQIRYYTNSADRILGSTLSSGQWYHVALVRGSGTTKLFVDGTQVGSDYTDTNNYGTTKPLTIGSRYDGGNVFVGYIDEFRISNTNRYTTTFTPRTGIFQGDANTKLLLHFDGEDGQVYVDDWSGTASWTNGDFFNNDAILATKRSTNGSASYHSFKTQRYLDAADLILDNREFLAAEIVYQLENSSPYAPFSVPTGSQSCIDDIKDVITQLVNDLRNGSNSYMWDAAALYVDRTANPVTLNHIETEVDESIWAYEKLSEFAQLVINNQTVTVTGNHGLPQTLNTTLTDSNDDSDPAYTANDCADVKSTIDNLITILTDTLDQANQPTPVDHLATVTKLTPAYEYLAGTFDAFYEVTFTVSSADNVNDLLYTNQIDLDSRNRFYDAANLIRLNRGAIVDKAAADLISRYPSLALDMPRNEDGTGSGTLRCKTDLGLILDNLAKDIEVGGNFNTITAIKSYLGANDEIIHIRLQLLQSVYAHTRLGYYMKQAINGDLDQTNTDNVIIGDWGITNDPGGCADVQSAIDTLIDLANDTLAPTGDRFRDAGNLLYFNKQYIAEESTGILDADFTYEIGPVGSEVAYSGFTYPDGVNGRTRCQTDIKLILDSVISDLLTGGNSNTIRAIGYYVTANLGITFVEDQLLATIYAFEQVKSLGAKAINNLLYNQAEPVTGDQYAAIYTSQDAYKDETITDSNGDAQYTAADCANVITAYESLWDTIIDTLSPGDTSARNGGRMVLFNRNYYKEELTNLVNNQWGVGAWVYSDYVDQILDDVIHDLAIADTSADNVLTTARNIDYSINSGTQFTVGETVTCSVNGTPVATGVVLENLEDDRVLIIGYLTGTWTTANATIIGASATALYIGNGPNSGLGATYDYYDKVANIQTLATARVTTSPIAGQVPNINLFTNPEEIQTNWTASGGYISPNTSFSPTDNLEAEEIVPDNTTGSHYIYRDYNLTSFDTFDDGVITLDDTTNKFDEGSSAETQTYTFSVFLRREGLYKSRLQITLDPGTAATKNAFFDVDLLSATIGSAFSPQGGLTIDDYGIVPVGLNWYRCYITLTFSFGISTYRAQIYARNSAGSLTFQGLNQLSNAIGVWGAKLVSGGIDPYQAQNGTIFYANNEYNIKNYIIGNLEDFLQDALRQDLTSPSSTAGFYAYSDASLAATYNADAITRTFRSNFNILKTQLEDDSYYTTLTSISGISVPSSTYGTRNIPIPLGGGIFGADNIYGLFSDSLAEVESVTKNEAQIVKVYKRFRIDGDITDGPFTMNEVVFKQGAPSVTGVVYGFYEDENFKYLDVEVTAGPWAVLDTIVGDLNSTTAQISAIESRIQVIDLIGDFEEGIEFKGYTSTETADTLEFIKTDAAVISNTGGKLTVDTESLVGLFETTSVVYAESSRQYLEVSKFAGFDVNVGQRIASNGYVRLGISIVSGLNEFTVGNRLYKVSNGIQDTSNYGVISEIDLDNNYLYVAIAQGNLTNGDLVGDYGIAESFPIGYASVITKVTFAGAGAALVQDVRDVGLNKRLYLSEIVGTFDAKDSILSLNGYKAVVLSKVDLKARVKRAFRGFDGSQTNFKLTTNNGDQYFPDPEGHMMIFVNGILQPPGASNSYTAFSDQIQFTEAPSFGSSFTGFYVGKLRQLDDISFDFDSLRQSFNLKRNGVFYSLTLTEGVQSSTIRPENNIIVSLNGVIQEPGVGFEIVGSRIIFSEIPRVGSTFVAFSYVGSEADVDAAEVVPPIEPGDFIVIQGETSDREVAVIESSNSLITFDYLGSVFGKDAIGQANLTSGTIEKVTITAPGSGYTSRPNVRIDSITGFDAQIRALVGVGGVTVVNSGSGYKNPEILVETTVPDDWTPPNLADYGAEVIDPEIL